MKNILVAMLLVCLCALVACQRRTKLGNPDFLPKNWITAKTTVWQVTKLPEENQKDLTDMKSRLMKERDGQYYNLFGRYKPETLEYIKVTVAELDGAYFNLAYSSEALLANLSPGMRTLPETHAEYAAQIAVTNNNNRRMLNADWRNARLLDHASTLSVAPVGR